MLSDQTFQPLIVIYRSGNFVKNHYWGCTPIYQLLSYPFRSLRKINVLGNFRGVQKRYTNKNLIKIFLTFVLICNYLTETKKNQFIFILLYETVDLVTNTI